MSKDVKYCKSFFQKTIGLMFSKRIDKPLVFLFNKEKRISIHMFFVFFPIDIIWLNKNKEVVYIKENVKPFAIINPKVESKYIIELAEDNIKKYKIEKGDLIELSA